LEAVNRIEYRDRDCCECTRYLALYLWSCLLPRQQHGFTLFQQTTLFHCFGYRDVLTFHNPKACVDKNIELGCIPGDNQAADILTKLLNHIKHVQASQRFRITFSAPYLTPGLEFQNSVSRALHSLVSYVGPCPLLSLFTCFRLRLSHYLSSAFDFRSMHR
jgi:hypothetical protein